VTEIYETLRQVNLAIACTLTLLMVFRAGAFARAPWPSKMGRLTVFGWVSSTAYGTWEALTLTAAPGFRIPTVTSVLCLSAFWLLEEYRDDRRHRHTLAAVRQVLRDSDPEHPAGR
jgi:hypothetical protein